MTREVERLTKRVIDEVRVEPTCRRLMTVPGVGPLTALAFRATIDQPGPLSQVARCRRPSRPDAAALSVWRDRRAGPHQPMRRRTGPHRTLRGSPFAADPQHQMVGVASLGHEHRQAPGHGTRPRRGRPQAGGDPAPHVGRRQRVPLGQAGRQRPPSHDVEEFQFPPDEGGAASFPWGRWAR